MPDPAAEPTPNRHSQPFAIRRIGVVMTPDERDPDEQWGVLNPATARSRNGELFLFPRVVASQNYSRIGIARVLFSHHGDPVGVERCGYALEPREPYEFNAHTGGCEDPRVTLVEPLDAYLMTYTAFGGAGSRIAFAQSTDLFEWKRQGLATFTTERGVDFNIYSNKDALIFPEAIQDPHGRPAIGLIHRPDYNVVTARGITTVLPYGVSDARPGMWLSYCPLDEIDPDQATLPPFRDHHLLAPPETPWEALKNGGGTVPMKTAHGWLTLFHGVSGVIKPDLVRQDSVYYAAGALVLDYDDPQRIVYRSREPILQPESQDERSGMIDNVVFPTGLDPRGDGRVDVYYGMADSRIGVGTLQIPAVLPTSQESSEAVA
jgi:beta-1,2-mannobiose phosphorylase / 1,2-beta-oligomannan phosphorylase